MIGCNIILYKRKRIFLRCVFDSLKINLRSHIDPDWGSKAPLQATLELIFEDFEENE